jgi:hypothetical protein
VQIVYASGFYLSRGRFRVMHIKNTIPVQFIANCALLKNIENSLLQENKTVDDLQLISEINQRLQIESNEILVDLYLQALDILRCGVHH